MSEEYTHSKKKKSKKSSSHSDEETAKINKAEIEEDDEEKRKEHKRKHKKHKHDKKSEDEAEQEEEKETTPPTCKNKKSDETDEKAKDSSLGLDIHSANNWEKAELDGDEKRKLKFLKLMGATKQKDSAISEEANKLAQHQHSRPTNEIKKIDQDLEKQFTESLTSKINRTNHVGLGFGGNAGFAPKPQSNTHKKFDDDDEPQKKSEAPSTSTSTETTKEDPKLKFKKMTFVKSNN